MKIKVNYSPTLNEVNELDLALATTPKGECIIGRSPDCDVVLDSPDVSRIHGKFFIQSGNYYFCDLGSRNGSIINGKLAEKNSPFLLKDKDIIRIGDYTMIVEDIIPASEQLAETVFRTIDPAIFSGRLSANQTPEVVSQSEVEVSQTQNEVEATELEEAINALENILETSEETGELEADVSTPTAEEEVTFIQSQDVDVITPTPEAVSEIPGTINQESVATPEPEEVTFIQPQDIITPTSEAVSEVPGTIDQESVATPEPEEVAFIEPQDVITPTSEAVSEVPGTIDQESVATPEPEEVTFIQPQDVITPTPEAVSENPTTINEESVATSNEIPGDINEQYLDEDAEILREFTIVQPRDIASHSYQRLSEVTPDINEQNIVEEEEILQEFTNVQPRDILAQTPESTSEVPADVAEILQDFTIVQPRNVNLPFDSISDTDESISSEDSVNEVKVDIAPVEAPEFVDNFTPEFSHDEEGTFTEDVLIVSGSIVSGSSDIVSEVPDISADDASIVETPTEVVSEVSQSADISDREVNLTANNTEELVADIGNLETAQDVDAVPATVNEVAEPTNIESLEEVEELVVTSKSEPESAEDETTPELVVTSKSEPEGAEDEVMPELVSNQTSESISQTFAEIFGTEKTLSDEIAEQQIPVSEPQPMISQKNIVLIAHDSKKSELAELVNQHKEFFSQSLTVAWPSISEVLSQQAGITISQQIPAATSGGYQTINSLVNSGEVLAVIFLRDFLVPQPGQANEEAFLRSCNINQVLLATNLPTAEAIVHYLKHL
ncbi:MULTISPECIES: FHA domain-containing protein [Calothrix]|uniref:FHA domain-containing protein n=2 Tax=Calothrix TaxID=1186 RepID=A0ABR8ADL3_9CYAN|nr:MULTISPECIES: FHA domain-containing protein [Calothrix]MBD2197859.1 FHA domain-containing protein [Calothrix parietina FACHB-288]MBD2226263.1 FHA domain-containing protein [Calothrix anomala FACHB-343]